MKGTIELPRATQRHQIAVPFGRGERERLCSFVARFDTTIGRFVREAIIEKIDREEQSAARAGMRVVKE